MGAGIKNKNKTLYIKFNSTVRDGEYLYSSYGWDWQINYNNIFLKSKDSKLTRFVPFYNVLYYEELLEGERENCD